VQKQRKREIPEKMCELSDVKGNGIYAAFDAEKRKKGYYRIDENLAYFAACVSVLSGIEEEKRAKRKYDCSRNERYG
jgi:hypothetical protein